MSGLKRMLSACLVLAVLICGGARSESFVEWILDDPDAAAAEESTPESTLPPPEDGAKIGTSQSPSGWEDLDALVPALPALTPPPKDGIGDCALEDDGMLRLNLKSLNAPESLNLTLNGIYAVEGDRGFRFEKDTQLTLTQEAGEVWLSVGGLTLDMGPSLTLTSHPDGWGELGGIVIAEAEKPTLYRGDLSVAAGNGGLQAILNIHIEDYLKGVVGYEMSDSFPLEALKAQAVAARTYALQRKWSSGKRSYDLVDTTADQVFKGFDPAFENVAAAVDDTRGVVGVWNGGFATCYYTASNGGQTALAGQILGDPTADGYLSMREDPYDLENPRSLESDLTVSANCDGSQKLKEMLTDALAPVMAEAGYAQGEWAFDAIEAIEPVDPRFEGSLLYDGLAFDLRVRVAESAVRTPTPEASETPAPAATAMSAADMSVAPAPERWIAAEGTYRVTLSVFDDIKEGLSLGLNILDCELISAEPAEGLDGGPAFRLVMRRFGHGVGMSQRGAQQMAGAHDKTWLEILNFYYPGMSVERMHWPERTPVSLENGAAVGAARPKPTPAPTAVPLGSLREGEHYATVTATSLNLRERPAITARIIDFLDAGSRLIVSGEPDADGWVPVRTGEDEGFVKAEYLDGSNQALE